MKTVTWALLIIMAGLLLTPPRAVANDRIVSVDLRDADVRQVVLRILKDAGLVDYVLTDEVRGKVTARMDGVSVDQALQVLLGSIGCEVVNDGGALIMRRRQELSTLAPSDKAAGTVPATSNRPVIMGNTPMPQNAPTGVTSMPYISLGPQGPGLATGFTGTYAQIAPGLYVAGYAPPQEGRISGSLPAQVFSGVPYSLAPGLGTSAVSPWQQLSPTAFFSTTTPRPWNNTFVLTGSGWLRY